MTGVYIHKNERKKSIFRANFCYRKSGNRKRKKVKLSAHTLESRYGKPINKDDILLSKQLSRIRT